MGVGCGGWLYRVEQEAWSPWASTPFILSVRYPTSIYPGLVTVVSEAAVLFVLKFVPSVGSRAEQLRLAHLTRPLISLQ